VPSHAYRPSSHQCCRRILYRPKDDLRTYTVLCTGKKAARIRQYRLKSVNNTITHATVLSIHRDGILYNDLVITQSTCRYSRIYVFCCLSKLHLFSVTEAVSPRDRRRLADVACTASRYFYDVIISIS